MNKLFTRLCYQLVAAAMLLPVGASAQLRLTDTSETVEAGKTATFEEFKLDAESFWNGSDLSGNFVSGSYRFNNTYTPEYGSWEGFTYANLTTTTFNSYGDATHFANAVGGGYNGSANYVVTNSNGWYGPVSIDVLNPEGETLRGFYITNAAVGMKAMKEGMAPARAFEKGDWLMLTIKDPETGKSVEYYLADYRSENEADHYILDTWQWVDLRELGNVKSLEFRMTGSDEGDWGLNTPSYFCMDDFNGFREITKAPAQLVEDGSSIELSQFFTFEDNAASVVYSIDEVSEGCTAEVSVNGTNLEINGNVDNNFDVTVKAVKKGKVYFVTIPCAGKNLTATFEDLKLDSESYWNGADMTGSFVSGSYKFNNTYTPEYGSWEGFIYANLTTTTFNSYGDATHFANAVGGGYNGSANYVVTNSNGWYGPVSIDVLNPEGETLRGFYITNAALGIKAMTEGMAPARAFEKGDWLMLTIKNPETDDKVEYYLADYRSENEADHYMLDTWQWVDLRELGNVKSLEFRMTGSDSGDWGLNTPSYFCMDDFNGHRVITEAPAQIVEEGTGIDLSQFFTFDNNDASVIYTVDEVSDDSYELEIADNKFYVLSGAAGEFTVVIKAVKKGKVYFASVPITVGTAIEGVEASDSYETERYTIDGMRVNNKVNGVNIIRNNNGKVKKVLVK